MNWLKKLNPVNSLFGRIFLWFWLAAIVLVLLGAWLAQLSNASYSMRPILPEMEQRMLKIGSRLEIVAKRKPGANLSLLLARAGQRNKLVLMLVNQRSREFTYGFSRGLGPIKAPFFELIEQARMFEVKTSSGKFYGPLLVDIDDEAHYLFAGVPNRQGALRRFSRANPVLLGVSVLLLSGVFCALFAWSLVRPIRDLQRSATQIAKGNLLRPALLASNRGDELGELARDFNTMTEQLERLLGSQRRLVADISHELRSPLARLQLAIGIAQNQPNPLPDNLQLQLQRIEKESQQMDRMIGDVLQLSRLEAKSLVEQKIQLSLQELLHEPLQDIIFETQHTQKTLQVSDIPDIQLSCYPQLLVSAVSNVVHNGIKFCSTKVEVSFGLTSTILSVHVQDDGPGVPPEDLADMFKPFYRLSTSRTRETGGVGLGLAIVEQAIAVHGGQVSASNRSEHGLEVQICVPLC